jgi:Fur family peroxide stress response transcriptional regulator
MLRTRRLRGNPLKKRHVFKSKRGGFALESRMKEALFRLKKFASGTRLTPQREAILEYMMTAMSHPTAEEVYKAVRDKLPNISLTTVYNTLYFFMEIGLVRMIKVDGFKRFEWITTKHCHVICKECGKVIDLYYPDLWKIKIFAEQKTGFVIEHHEIEVYGACADCKVLHRKTGESSDNNRLG